MEIVYGIHGLTPKHGCSPEDVILISFSLQPSWGSVNSTPARVYTVVNTKEHLGALHACGPRLDADVSSIWKTFLQWGRSRANSLAKRAAGILWPESVAPPSCLYEPPDYP